jgi:hypothetical protein
MSKYQKPTDYAITSRSAGLNGLGIVTSRLRKGSYDEEIMTSSLLRKKIMSIEISKTK